MDVSVRTGTYRRGYDQWNPGTRMRQDFDLVLVDGAGQRRCENVGGGAPCGHPSLGGYRHTMGVGRRKPQIVQDHDNRTAAPRESRDGGAPGREPDGTCGRADTTGPRHTGRCAGAPGVRRGRAAERRAGENYFIISS